MFWQRLFLSFALVLLLSAQLSAQTTGEQSTLDEQEQQQKALELKKELERKTLALLDEIVSSAATLRLPENRALVLSSAADLLWTRDEKRARALFKEAVSNLNASAIKFDDKLTNEQRTSQWMLAQQRREILQMIARRDADLALELLRASRPQVLPVSPAGKGPQPLDEEREMEQSLAVQVAANDPKRAFQMAESTLSKGLSFQLLALLSRLNDKDNELAARLADDIIARLQSENLATNQEAAFLAIMLLRMSFATQAEGYYLAIGSVEIDNKPFKLSERQLRDLLEMVTTAALGGTPGLSLLSFLPALMPEIEKRMPERAAILRARIAQHARNLDSETRMFIENQELIQTGTIEALLEAAAKATGKSSAMLYEQAAWKAFDKGDAERARKIINDNIKDAANRERILESYENMSLWNSMRKENLDEVREKLARIKSKDQRVSVLVQLAFAAALKKDKKLASALLNEALPLVNLKPKKDVQLYNLLQVVRVFALVEPARAFALIESLVDQANELLAAASVLNGFLLPSRMFRKGEMFLPPGYTDVSLRFRDFGKQLAALALVNFERTKAAADKFQRNEARIMARLFIAQGVLSEQLGSGVALYQGGMMTGY